MHLISSGVHGKQSGQEEEDGVVLEIPSNTAEMMWHEVQVQAVVDDTMESDISDSIASSSTVAYIPQERLPIDGVATEDIPLHPEPLHPEPLHPEPLHPEQPTCSKDCPTDITETDRGDFEIDTDPFLNTIKMLSFFVFFVLVSSLKPMYPC